MKVKRIIANFVVLLAAAAAVFYVGWIQFSVEPGYCGVMESKTGGVYPKPVLAGQFAWRWERLLPTNVRISKFPLAPCKSEQEYTGSLPSAETYARMVDGGADFSYAVRMTLSLSLPPEELVKLAASHEIKDEADLSAWYEARAKVISKKIVDSLLEGADASAASAQQKALSKSEIDALSAAAGADLAPATITDISIDSVKIPDYTLYESAKKLYEDYQEDLKDALKAKAEQHAAAAAESDRTLEQLEKYAQLLEKYPQLKDIPNLSGLAGALNGLQ